MVTDNSVARIHIARISGHGQRSSTMYYVFLIFGFGILIGGARIATNDFELGIYLGIGAIVLALAEIIHKLDKMINLHRK